MAYKHPVTRADPCLILFMLDQSASMEEDALGSHKSKAQELAEHVNATLQDLLLKCTRSGGVRDYLEIAALGYAGPEPDRAVLTNLLKPKDGDEYIVPISRLVEWQLGTVEQAGGIRTPVWVRPVAYGWTPMCGALRLARRITSEWVKEHEESFPPVVVNVTDGAMTDGTTADLLRQAGQLKTVSTTDGSALLLNVHLASASEGRSARTSVVLPDSKAVLPQDDEFSHALWDSSSPLPPELVPSVRSKGIEVTADSRLFCYNATPTILSSILAMGTTLQMPPR